MLLDVILVYQFKNWADNSYRFNHSMVVGFYCTNLAYDIYDVSDAVIDWNWKYLRVQMKLLRDL